MHGSVQWVPVEPGSELWCFSSLKFVAILGLAFKKLFCAFAVSSGAYENEKKNTVTFILRFYVVQMKH